MKLRSCLSLVFLVLVFPGVLFAQTQSGSIRGTVVTAGDSGVLPGVTVTITGAGLRQTFVTESGGEFRFLNLHPGVYTLTAELAGFATATRDVDVALGRGSEISLALAPAVNEAITVTAATPMIDTRDTATGANVDNFELTAIPTARDPWVILQSVPGVLVDRVNVGGNESGQQSYFVGKGVERHQTEWNIDGVAVTDMAATGTSTFYYDFDSFDELQVTTGGSDPSVRTPGVHLNMVTKRGTNEIQGSGRFFTTDKSYQADATIPAEAADYLAEGGNSINHIDDYGLEAGGPLLRDKLWAWGAYSSNRIENFASGEAVLQKTRLKNYNGKFNYQPLNNNNAEVFYMWSDKTVAGRGLGTRRRTIEVAQNQTGPGDLLKLEDTHIFSQSLYLTGNFATIKSGYKLDPIGGRTADAWWDEEEGWHRTYSYFEQTNPQKNARVDGAAYVHTGTVGHELKFGFGYRDTPVQSATVWPGNGNFGNFYDGYALAALTRPAVPNFGSHYVDAFVGDTVSFGNVTVTGGFRYDIQRAKNFGSEVPANPVVPDLLPAVSYGGDERALEWKGISPRIGATWALGQEKKTLLKANYGRYMDQLGSSDAGSSNPFYRVQMLYYYWEDLNGDKTVQRNEIDFDSGLYSFKNIDPDHPGAPFSAGRLDYNMDPTTTDELILGVDREIAPNFAIGVSYTYRYRTNFLWDQYEKTQGANDFYTSADYVLLNQITGTLPNGTAYSVPNYRLRAGTAAPVFYVTTNRPDYHQTYNGLELTATKRFSNKWMLRGNVTLSDWKQHVGTNGFVDPTHIVDDKTDSCTACNGDVVASSGGLAGYINSRWAYSVNASYELPFGIQAGAALIGREGYVIPYYRRTNNRDGVGNKQIMVSEEFGSNRLPDLFNLDLRLGRDFNVSHGVVVNLAVDLFNATNERTVLWRDNRMYSANGGDNDLNNWIEQLQSPRIWRAGARVRF